MIDRKDLISALKDISYIDGVASQAKITDDYFYEAIVSISDLLIAQLNGEKK